MSIVDQIRTLSIKYPDKVSLYTPVSNEIIRSYEERLNVIFPKELYEIWRYSNGMGVLDYCINGVGNKRISDMFDSNYPIQKSEEHVFLDFMGTSGGQSFYVKLAKDNVVKEVVISEDYLETSKMVAPNLEVFFDQFFFRVDQLIQEMSSNDQIDYIDY